MAKLKEMKQGTKLNNKQQNSSKANITISASVTSSNTGTANGVHPTGCQAISSVRKVLGKYVTSLQQLNSNYPVKQPKNDITERDNTITTSSLSIRKFRKKSLLKNTSIPIDCIKITTENNHFIDNLNWLPVAPEQQQIRKTYM